MAGADTNAILAGTNALAQQQLSPVAQFGQYANALNAGIQLRQNQMGLQRAQAQAQAYKDNTDSNGNTNYQAMMGELAQIPGGAYALPQAAAAMLARQKAQYDLNQQQLTQTENRTNVFNSALTPLIRKGSGVTAQDVYSTIAGSVPLAFQRRNLRTTPRRRCRPWTHRKRVIRRRKRLTVSSCRIGS